MTALGSAEILFWMPRGWIHVFLILIDGSIVTTHRHKFRSTMNSNRRRWGCGVLYSVRNNYGRPQCPSSTAGSFCTTRFLPFPRLSVVMGVGGWLFPSISRGTVAYRQGGGFLSTPEIPFYSIPTLEPRRSFFDGTVEVVCRSGADPEF